MPFGAIVVPRVYQDVNAVFPVLACLALANRLIYHGDVLLGLNKMTDSYKEITGNLNKNLAKLRKDIPEVMGAFHQLATSATTEGALDKKTKELIALAVGVAGHCKGCIGFHVKALVRLGVTREELTETLGMAIYMGGGPSLMYAADALKAFEEFSEH